MADNNVVFKVAADFDNAIKEWEQLRDKVADTTKEYQDAQKEIENLKKAKAELTGETIKSNEAFKKETESQRESTSEYKKRKKDIEDAFKSQEVFNKSVGTSSVLSFDNSINATKKERDALIQLRNTLDITGDEFTVVSNKISLLDQKLNTSAKGMSGGLKTITEGMHGAGKATGAATTSVLELGRIVSDAPYGIRGMANNVSQLASNMLFGAQQIDKATGKAVGFNGVLKGMGKAFIGPLGVLFAIQAVVAAFDHFYGGAKKAEKATADFTNLVDEKTAKLLILNKVLSSSNTSLEQKKDIVNDVNQEFDELNISLDENGKLTKKSQEAVDKLTASMIKNAKAQAVLKKITSEQSKIVDIELERSDRITKGGVGAFKGTLEDLEKQRQKYIDRHKKQIDESNLSQEQKEKALDNYMKSSSMQRFDALRDFRKKDLEDAEENIDKLVKLIEGGFGSGGSGGGSTKIKLLEIDDFDKQLEDYLSQIAGVEEKEELLLAKLNSDKVMIQEKYHLEKLEAKNKENKDKFKQQADAHRIEYKAFLDQQVRMTPMTQEEADVKLNDFDKDIAAQQKSSQDNFDILVQKTKDFYFEKLFLALQSEQKGTDVVENENQKKIDGLVFYVERYKEIMGGMSSFIDGEFDRQLTTEQNKTNVLNNELNKRLENENLSKDQRENIQNQIWQNDEKLRVAQERIAKKKFIAAKAFNISMALADTYLSAQKAYLSQLTIPTPDAPIRAAFAAKVAVATGLLNVAAIASQKFQSTSASAPPVGSASGGGSGSGGVGDRSFDFNLVGNTQQNQLANAIGSKFDKPLQAFVVSKDITTQQELDANIQGQARI